VDYVLNGGTAQQRTWFVEAWEAFFEQYQADMGGYTIQVYWVAEPPCPGHEEYACSHEDDNGDPAISFRNTLDTGPPPYGGRLFYMEGVAHEIAHHIMWWWGFDSDMGLEEMFGATPADWNPTGAVWGTQVSEAVAETIKDIWLPRSYRAFDNRTRWRLLQARFTDFVDAVCPTQTVYRQVEYTLTVTQFIEPSGGVLDLQEGSLGTEYHTWEWRKPYLFQAPPYGGELAPDETAGRPQVLGIEQVGPPVPPSPIPRSTWWPLLALNSDPFNEFSGWDYILEGLWQILWPGNEGWNPQQGPDSLPVPEPPPPTESFTGVASVRLRVGIERVIRCPARWPYGGVVRAAAGPAGSRTERRRLTGA